MTKHLARDPVTGRFIRAEPIVYMSTPEAPKEEIITWKWVVAVVLSAVAIVVLAYLFKAEPEPTYIVVRDTFELAGSDVPEAVVAEVQKETPAPQKREIKIYRNGQFSETVSVD
jgi:hypothetical protein